MADLQITGLSALAEAGIQPSDVLALADLSASETKKVTVKDLVNAVVTDSGTSFLAAGAIPGSKIGTLGTNAVVTASITDLNVTAAKIANNTITATQIAANAIGTSELADNAVDTGALAANSVTTAKITDLNITTDKLASNAVTTVKITDSSVTFAKLNLSDGDIPGAKLTSASVTATQIATNAVTSTELADNAVDTAAIASGAVTSAKIASNTIVAGNIGAGAITSSELAANSVTTSQIADGAVTAAKLSGTLAATSIADDAVTTAKILDDAVTSAKLAANAVDATALADNAVDSGALASNAVIEAKIAANAVVNAKIADGTITAAKLNTSNIDRSLNVASGNLGINNAVTGGAATRSGITYNAQGLITGSVALAAGDLPVSTTSAVGGVSIASAGGLAITGAGALSIAATTTGATATKVTFNNFGQITGTATLAAADLPLATASAVGGVSIAAGGPLSVDGNGALTVSNSGVSAGTGTKVTVDAKGIVTALTNLSDSDLPNHSAALLTSGSIAAARIGNDTIDGTKLSNSSTALFQSIAQQGYPTAQFNGQILFDTVSEDAFIWDGNAWQAITTLTKGSLVFGGTFNASTSQMVATTSAGIAAGLSVGSNLPTPSATTDGVYVVVSSSGTPSAPAPVVALAPPDYVLGITNSAGSSWNEVDLSQTVAGQVASNITFTPYGQVSATNVQDAIQELETEKLALSGGTVTGQVLIGNTGSLVFEGSTIDAYETTLTVADPTSSDKTITFPDTTGTVITSGDTGTVTSTMLLDGTIVNADINASAAIALTKLANVTAAQIIVGNGSNVPTAVAVTGDISINNAGLTAIAAGVIVDADISGSAAITGSKIATGTTSAVGVLQLTDSAASTSATTAATPAAVKTAKDAADAAASTANAALPKTGGTMTGNLTIDNAKEIRLSEADGDGANYTGLKAQAQSADIVLTLPAVAPTTGQVLKSSSTATTLEWATDSATDSTKLPLAGGTLTGNLTLNAQSDVRFADADSSHYIALQSPGTIASSFTLTLPATDAAVSGYVLASDASGTLSWVDPGSSSSPTFTGDATLTNDGALVGFSNLSATYTGNSKTLTVTVATKTGAHRYNGTGSSSGYKIGGKEAPFLTLTPGRTYVFDQADNSNSGHPLRFYLEADKTTAYTTGVTTNGTAGSAGAYTQIVVSDTTPQILHYQCSAHGFMGNSVQANSNIASTAKTLATARTIGGVSFDGSANINLAGVNAAGNQDTSGTAAVATAITIADESSDTTCFPLFATAATGDLGAKSGSNLTFNSSSGALTATSFVGALTGNVTGNASGSAATVTGAAQSAITSVGTLTGLTVDGDVQFSGAANNVVWDKSDNALEFADDAVLRLGADNDLEIFHQSSSTTNFIKTTNASAPIQFQAPAGETLAKLIPNGAVELYHDNIKVFNTASHGIEVLGPEGGTANVYMYADEGDDNADKWGLEADTSGNFNIRNYSTGSWVDGLTLDGSNNATFAGSIQAQDFLNIQNGTGTALSVSTVGDFVAKFESTDSHAAIVLEDPNSTNDGNRVQVVGDSLLLVTGGTTALTLDSSQNATFAGTVSDSKGNLRSIPQNMQGSAYTLVAADAGKHIITGSGVTIPNNVFAVGDAVTIISNSNSDQTITQASGLTIYNTADGSTGNRTLATRGMCTLIFTQGGSSSYAYISGAGLT